ncbi:hypothetical protein ACFU99_35585 [Streptomyces sp. NPDC057654]|uniref:hypothetical protein n=1 Tax=Streptomyces sp. NPDC057654 TaxID=3346196 RepID=UPI0036BEA4D3
MKGKTVYGLARVRYGDGHKHAGHYEVERVSAPPILVPFGDAEPGPNADQIPPGVELPNLGAAYHPLFAEPGVQEACDGVSGANVIFPGSMRKLRELITLVQSGWAVHWISHEANEFRGQLDVAEVSASGVRMNHAQGAPSRYAWPLEGDDFTIQGTAITEYKADHAYTGGRASTLTLRFEAPRQPAVMEGRQDLPVRGGFG